MYASAEPELIQHIIACSSVDGAHQACDGCDMHGVYGCRGRMLGARNSTVMCVWMCGMCLAFNNRHVGFDGSSMVVGPDVGGTLLNVEQSCF
jgi:hypothetical protein